MAFCTITQSIYTYMVDGSDEGREPDKLPANGRVTFTPILNKGETIADDGETIALIPIEARITNGQIYHRGQPGIMLYAGGDGVPPIRYKATYHNVVAGTHSLKLADKTFTTTPDTTLDLTGDPQ